MISTIEKTCDFCNYTTSDITNYKKHLLTAKHKRLSKSTNNANECEKCTTVSYYCECCDFNSRNKYDYNRHNQTKKHQISFMLYQKRGDSTEKTDVGSPQIEEKQIHTPQQPQQQNGITTDIVMELLKQNKEIQNSLVEQNKELHNTLLEMSKQNKVINTMTTNNITNNQFNLNVFLNEDCKQALNIADFIDSLKLTVNDIEETGKLGYTQGITRIIIKALNDLDVTMRPLHCTDIKRETVYIKDQDTWEKEDAEKTKLRNVLKQIARKNLKMLPEWQEQNPDFKYLDTPENEKFMQISLSSLGSEYEDEQDKMEDKIIRNVLKEVVLEKKK
jgi:predicted nuclease of restriction endonuclease-like (RecB) superfamily